MNCRETQNELGLSFGRGELPREVRRHIDGCAECAVVLAELEALTRNAGGDEDFYADAAELDQMVALVDESIDAIELETVVKTTPIWSSYIPAVAALVVIIGLSLTISLIGVFDRSGVQLTSNGDDSEQALVDFDGSDLTDAELIPGLIEDFESGSFWQASGLILEDLTEEEFEYLANNIDVGEML